MTHTELKDAMIRAEAARSDQIAMQQRLTEMPAKHEAVQQQQTQKQAILIQKQTGMQRVICTVCMRFVLTKV